MSRITGREHRGAKSRAVVLWSLLFFALAQAGLDIAMEHRPDLRDPEYGLKLEQLRKRLSENPSSRPLVIALGSSRVSFGLCFECLRGSQPTANNETTVIAGENPHNAPPLAFNFGLSGFTPSEQLMCLRRLLADGIHPDLVVAEFTPVLIGNDESSSRGFDVNRLRWQDVGRMAQGVPNKSRFYWRWCRAQLVPWHYHRCLLLNRFVPSWLEAGIQLNSAWLGLDASGWVQSPFFQNHFGDDVIRREVDFSRPHFQRLGVPQSADSAFRDLNATCNENGIKMALLLTPEDSRIRSLNTPQSLKSRNDYLRRFAQENGCGVIDATTWVRDDEFADGCHVTYAGAITLTRRFDREILRVASKGGLAMIAKRMDVPADEPTSPILARRPQSPNDSTK
jgi:hypothetical protein